MKSTRTIAVITVFTAAIIGSDFVLAPYPNVKLLDALVFISAYLFGFRVGSAVAILSETTWSLVSPWGVAGAITPFLVSGELLFAAAGWVTSKAWGEHIRPVSTYSFVVGSLLAVCAFVWDFETNAATALLSYWPDITVQKLISVELYGALFAVAHELSDFLLGITVIPVALFMLSRTLGRRT